MAQLKYSELTHKIYFTHRDRKYEIDENNFIQMILLWMHKDLPEEAQGTAKSITQEIVVDNIIHYELSLKKII
jgi:hypothetical protein